MENGGSILVHGGAGAIGVVMSYGSELSNTGAIVAQAAEPGVHSVAIDLQAYGAYNLVNSGRIQADIAVQFDSVSDGSSVQLSLDNTGKILGAIDLGAGVDVIDNGGTIRGDILLGADNDAYHGAAGKLDGTVWGGQGDDQLIGGKGADQFYGDDGDGGPNGGADLLIGGGGGDSLRGEAGQDTLIGGKGADVLSGGDGADSFIFERLSDSDLAHPDLITDLDASDLIRLSAIDADTTQAGDQAFALVTTHNGHAGQAAMVYDAAHDLTRLELDVDGDGQADAIIQIAGDHRDFANFAL